MSHSFLKLLNVLYVGWVTISSFLNFNSWHSCKWNKTLRFLSLQLLAVTPRGSPQAQQKVLNLAD